MEVNSASERIICDLLKQRTGQHISQSRRWRITSALSALYREHGIDNLDQLACLLTMPGKEGLSQQVVEALLNNETYFFRDLPYFTALVDNVLPQVRRNRAGQRRLRIWSAGCSTGQEALSLAMLFLEEPQKWTGWSIDIVGTDISAQVIATAQAGRYNQFEIQRGIGVHQMLRYFEETPDGWQAKDCLRKMIDFRVASIFDRPPAQAPFDIVLCRNVMLYFTKDVRRQAFAHLTEGLAMGGWLILGAGEGMTEEANGFSAAQFNLGFFRHVGPSACADDKRVSHRRPWPHDERTPRSIGDSR